MGKGEALVIGDLHACFDEFQEMLKLVGWRKDGPLQVVLAGDLVDRGPEPGAVVKFCRENGILAVMGNHEESHFAYQKSLERQAAGEKVKIRQLDSEKVFTDKQLTTDDWAWLRQLPMILRIRPDVLVVHAGLEPGRPLNEQTDVVLRLKGVEEKTGLKEKYQSTSSYKISYSKSCAWTDLWKGPECVIYGHVVHSHYSPKLSGPRDKKGNIVGPWTLGIDTGCVFGGHLTGYLVDRNEIVQVRAKHEYYGYGRSLTVHNPSNREKAEKEGKDFWGRDRDIKPRYKSREKDESKVLTPEENARVDKAIDLLRQAKREAVSEKKREKRQLSLVPKSETDSRDDLWLDSLADDTEHWPEDLAAGRVKRRRHRHPRMN